MPKMFRRVVDRLQERRQIKEEEHEIDELVQEWKRQFEIDRRAKAEWDEKFAEWEGIYNGDREFRNQTFTGMNISREMRTNINFPRMIVERLIDPNVPQPDFRPVAKDDENAVDGLKSYVEYVVRACEPSLEEINLQDERRVKKFGGTFRKVHWNNNVKKAGYVGEIELSNPHPKDIIINKGATSIQDMEHYHHCVNYTGREIMRKYPDIDLDDLEDKAIYIEDLDNLEAELAYLSSDGESRESGLRKYTIIETTYRDEDGDICKLWWSGDLFIKHLPKFYWRRDENGNPIEMETLEEGTEIRKTMPDGEEGFEVLTEDTEVEYYIPKRWDIVYEPYIPRDKCFWGISLIEDIHDLNEAIKKAVYQAEERRLRGSKKILVSNEEDAKRILDPASEVIPISGEVLQVVDLNAPDDIMWIEKLKEWLQLLTGATNAAMGVEMPSVTSGEQAKVYVEQANKKIGNSSAYKASTYKQLYRVIADFALAFADGDRPFRLSGEGESVKYGKFNRLNMLKDDSGNLFYPDYDVEIGADAGFLQQRGQIMQAILDLAGQGRFETSPANIRVLRVLKKIGVPYLDEIIENMEEELDPESMENMGMGMQDMGDMPMPQGEMPLPQIPMGGMGSMAGQDLPPELLQILEQLPPEIQKQVLELPLDSQAAFLMELVEQMGGQGQGQMPMGVEQPSAPQGIPSEQDELMQLIYSLPPELQAEIMQLLQTDPNQAMAMLAEIAGQGQMM